MCTMSVGEFDCMELNAAGRGDHGVWVRIIDCSRGERYPSD